MKQAPPEGRAVAAASTRPRSKELRRPYGLDTGQADPRQICYAGFVQDRAVWDHYSQAVGMFLSGATVPTASRISLVVGTWLSLMNQGDLLVDGTIPWIKILLNYATPFIVASLGFLAARRRTNVERLARLLGARQPPPASGSGA